MGEHVGPATMHGILAEQYEGAGIQTKPLQAGNGRHNKDNEPYTPHWDVPLTPEEEAEEQS